MNADSIRQLFDSDAMTALAPLMILTLGFLCTMLASVLRLSRTAHVILVAATFLGAGVYLGRMVAGRFDAGDILGGAFVADRATYLWGLIFVAATFVAWLFSLGHDRETRAFQNEHDLLVLCTPAGMLLMAGAGNLLMFFVGLELLSIPLYALTAFRRERPSSVEAGLKYFLLGALAAALFLFGSALFYTATGSISLAGAPQALLTTPLALAGLGLITVSVLFKLGVFPFHLWVPDVYQGAPTAVTALMAGGTKAAAFAFLVRTCEFLPDSTATAVGVLALITMLLGNLGALAQDDLKRMLAYSGVAHAGTLLLAIAARLGGHPNPGGAMNAGLFYLCAYAFTAVGAFGCIAVLERQGEHFTRLDCLRGLATRRPFVAAALTLFLLSLGGIPLTGGFMGKWLVFSLTVQAHMWGLTVAAVLMSVIALGYYLKVIVAMYMRPELENLPRDEIAGRNGLLPSSIAACLCAAMVLVTGTLPNWLLRVLP